jgi:hypothetical protein
MMIWTNSKDIFNYIRPFMFSSKWFYMVSFNIKTIFS